MSDDANKPTGGNVINMRDVFAREQKANGHKSPIVTPRQEAAGRDLVRLENATARIKSLTNTYYMHADTLQIYKKSGQVAESDLQRHSDILMEMHKCLRLIAEERKAFH